MTVYLLPHEQRNNFRTILLEKLKSQYEKKAFEYYGIIENIINIEEISHEEMMKIVPTVHFRLKANVITYVPTLEDVLTMPITKILSCGIYIEDNCFRVLLSRFPSGYTAQKHESGIILSHDVSSTTIKAGTSIQFKLLSIRFEKNSFHCLGDIITNEM